uniref:RNA-directed DNA polymerase n=1 Tax=Anopheles epiroticus TaxID=199890 RepID=A0A182PWK1_9DIPT
MNGSERLPLFVIGKSRKPRCFKHCHSLPVKYYNNKNAWMTTAIFQEWLEELDQKFIIEKRHVILGTIRRNVRSLAEFRVPVSNVAVYLMSSGTALRQEIENIPLQQLLKVSDNRLKEIAEETKKDQAMQLLIQLVLNGWPKSADKVPDLIKQYYGYRNELTIQDGLIFREHRILIPQSLRRKLSDRCHLSHNGIEATLKLAKANLFWPGMAGQIKEVISKCNICAKFADSQRNPPMLSHSIPILPFQLVSMDVFFAEYHDILKDMSPQSVIAACRKNFARHGRPQRVITDNGTNFVNKHMIDFAKEWDFELVTSSPYHQQANGKSEAAVKITKRLLEKAQDSGTDFWLALLNWRNIPNKIGSSPTSRLFSRSTKCGVPISSNKLVPKVVNNVPDFIKKQRRKIKEYYDKKTRTLPELEIGSP